jgi:type IV pilus assembly protein PilW
MNIAHYFSLGNIRTTKGFSLIELMISILIGLIVLNGVIQIVVGSKRSYLDNQAISQIQENARFALDTLAREIRVAGYMGCMPLSLGEIDPAGLAGTLDTFIVSGAGDFVGVEVFDNITDATRATLPDNFRADVLANTDVLIVRHTDVAREYVLTDNLVAFGDSSINVAGEADIRVDEPLALVSRDCQTASLFSAGEVNLDATSTTISAADTSGLFGLDTFEKGSRVSPIVVAAYYIGNSSVVTNMPALKREVISFDAGGVTTRSEELAVGVENLQLELGQVAAGAVNFAAGGNADAAIAVRVNLALRSQQAVADEAREIVTLGVTNNDRFIRQVASTTVRIRNRG